MLIYPIRVALPTRRANAALRRRLGEAGRQRVVDAYSVTRWEPVLAGLLQDAASRR